MQISLLLQKDSSLVKKESRVLMQIVVLLIIAVAIHETVVILTDHPRWELKIVPRKSRNVPPVKTSLFVRTDSLVKIDSLVKEESPVLLEESRENLAKKAMNRIVSIGNLVMETNELEELALTSNCRK